MPYIRDVYDSLREIGSAVDTLKTLAMRERQAIVELDLAGLEGRRKDIDAKLSHIGTLYELLAIRISTACDAIGMGGERTLSQLITAVPKPDRDMYTKLQKSIRADSQSAENDLAINRALIEDSLAFATHSLETVTGLLKTTTSTTYGERGRFVDTTNQPRIICKEI